MAIYLLIDEYNIFTFIMIILMIMSTTFFLVLLFANFSSLLLSFFLTTIFSEVFWVSFFYLLESYRTRFCSYSGWPQFLASSHTDPCLSSNTPDPLLLQGPHTAGPNAFLPISLIFYKHPVNCYSCLPSNYVRDLMRCTIS